MRCARLAYSQSVIDRAPIATIVAAEEPRPAPSVRLEVMEIETLGSAFLDL